MNLKKKKSAQEDEITASEEWRGRVVRGMTKYELLEEE